MMTKAEPWRAWYGRQRWRKRARHQLTLQPWCKFCADKGIAKAASVADHVVAHKGNEMAFWFGELQSLCHGCHVKTKAYEERHGYKPDISLSGWPVDAKHPANQDGDHNPDQATEPEPMGF
jgi:hypothetical protein